MMGRGKKEKKKAGVQKNVPSPGTDVRDAETLLLGRRRSRRQRVRDGRMEQEPELARDEQV